ncbi:MAG: putative acylesterase/phospholipase RssA [Myxococcota bacterium]|jgi:predicted acylesterase/phospholipase RssA
MNEAPSVVFAGGGCRAFWSLGVWQELSRETDNVREWAGVSAGSAMAVACAAGNVDSVVEAFQRRTAANRSNIYLGRLLKGQPAFPHEAIYRQTILETMTPEVFAALQSASPVRILHAYVEAGKPVVRTVFGALMAYRSRRKVEGVHGPRAPHPGIGEEVVTVQDARTPDAVVDQVLSSSASPPVTSTPKREGRTYFDGSLVDNVPVRALSEGAKAGKVVVMLTRPAPEEKRPNSPTRLYLAPQSSVPVHKWDYTSPDRITETFELGREDGRRYREAFQRFLG